MMWNGPCRDPLSFETGMTSASGQDWFDCNQSDDILRLDFIYILADEKERGESSSRRQHCRPLADRFIGGSRGLYWSHGHIHADCYQGLDLIGSVSNRSFFSCSSAPHIAHIFLDSGGIIKISTEISSRIVSKRFTLSPFGQSGSRSCLVHSFKNIFIWRENRKTRWRCWRLAPGTR